MSKTIKLGDILKVEDFNPMEVDITYIEETIQLIPKSGMIDLNQAEQLATAFLRCADYCSSLIAQAVRLIGYRDAEKKSQKGTAIETKIQSKVPATTAREVYGNDENFIKACNSHTEAQVWSSWINQKYDNLIRAHVLCKDILKSQVQSRNVANWEAKECTENFVPPAPPVPQQPTKKVKPKIDGDNDEFDFDIGDEFKM